MRSVRVGTSVLGALLLAATAVAGPIVHTFSIVDPAPEEGARKGALVGRSDPAPACRQSAPERPGANQAAGRTQAKVIQSSSRTT
jgi:hypothetical protein